MAFLLSVWDKSNFFFKGDDFFQRRRFFSDQPKFSFFNHRQGQVLELSLKYFYSLCEVLHKLVSFSNASQSFFYHFDYDRRFWYKLIIKRLFVPTPSCLSAKKRLSLTFSWSKEDSTFHQPCQYHEHFLSISSNLQYNPHEIWPGNDSLIIEPIDALISSFIMKAIAFLHQIQII